MIIENAIGILFILFSICLVVTICFTRADSDSFVCCFGGTCAFLISLLVVAIIYDCTPTAMEVYQGKTTLEYKVVDGVKVDSTVVWKNNQ